MSPKDLELPRCERGRREMPLSERVAHFERCTHPQCLTLRAFYERIAARCRRELFKLVEKEDEQ